MDREAIKQLQDPALAEALNERLDDLNVIATPDHFQLHDLEKYLPRRRRYRARLETASPDDFAQISLDTEGDGKRCFIDADSMSAETVFNLGTEALPGHGDHRARLRLQKTAEFQALESVSGRQMSQKELAEWLEDWREQITGYTGAGETVEIKKVIARVRDINITATAESNHEDRDLSAKRTRMEEISASSRDGEMPAGIIFKCRPYEGLTERDITARLSLITGDRPAFVLRLTRPEHLQQQIAKEFQQLLIARFGEDVPTFLGTISL